MLGQCADDPMGSNLCNPGLQSRGKGKEFGERVIGSLNRSSNFLARDIRAVKNDDLFHPFIKSFKPKENFSVANQLNPLVMNWKFWKKKEQPKPKTFLREWSDAIVFAVVVATFIRWSAVQAFVIPTPSMENSLLVGDYLFVSKLHYGPQTPKTPLQIPLTHQHIPGTEIKSYLDWIQLPTYRFPGLTKIKREDVVVFYIPPVSLNKGVNYPFDLKSNYVKRCVGLPGDRLEIKGAKVYANGTALGLPENMKFSYIVTARDEIHKRNLLKLGLDKDDFYFLGRLDEEQVVLPDAAYSRPGSGGEGSALCYLF